PPRTAAELLHELQVHQIELEMQNESLRQSQAALEESRDAYTDLYDFAPVGYLTLTAEGFISRINLTGAAQLRMPREKLVGRRFASFVAPEDRDRWYRHWSGLRGGREQDTAELALRRGDGTAFNAQIDCVRHRAPTGAEADGAPEIRMALTDITPRKAAERDLVEAREAADQSSRAKSTFLATMSHEMRTPLHVIIGLAHLLRRDLVESAQQERVDQLFRTSDHLLAVINDVLDLTKIEARRFVLDKTDFMLGSAVNTVVRMVESRAREKGLSLSVELDPRASRLALTGDPLRLAQVLINLCGNAVKFTDAGEVRVSIGVLAEDGDCVTLRFAVTDTGIGISTAEQARLFHAFSQADSSPTRQHEGTGLGLAISQHLVSLMGGSIGVASEPGQGSTFSFTLVLPRASERFHERRAAFPASPSFHGGRVLLVEDHPLAQDILFEMLEDLGCLVDVASDGTEAVACAREHGYDVILMDMQMPRMNGLAATRAIREIPIHRDTPIIAVTANAFVEDRQRCLDAGMNGHLSKPVTPASLAAALGQWMPGLAAVDSESPLCEDELSSKIPGLTVPANWRRSPEGLAAYCTQLERFIQMHSATGTQLRERLAAGANESAATLAHDLKGIAALLGAERIASLAGEIEGGIRKDLGKDRVAALIADCETELVRLAEAFRRVAGLGSQLADENELNGPGGTASARTSAGQPAKGNRRG
ncbi:MAG TPA: response regulator, partial [Rhodocyclaceae bacterium]